MHCLDCVRWKRSKRQVIVIWRATWRMLTKASPKLRPRHRSIAWWPSIRLRQLQTTGSLCLPNQDKEHAKNRFLVRNRFNLSPDKDMVELCMNVKTYVDCWRQCKLKQQNKLVQRIWVHRAKMDCTFNETNSQCRQDYITDCRDTNNHWDRHLWPPEAWEHILVIIVSMLREVQLVKKGRIVKISMIKIKMIAITLQKICSYNQSGDCNGWLPANTQQKGILGEHVR